MLKFCGKEQFLCLSTKFPHRKLGETTAFYAVVFSPNTGKHRLENLWIRTLFTWWEVLIHFILLWVCSMKFLYKLNIILVKSYNLVINSTKFSKLRSGIFFANIITLLAENIRVLLLMNYWVLFTRMDKIFNIYYKVSLWLTFTCSNSAIETLEKDVKYVQS